MWNGSDLEFFFRHQTFINSSALLLSLLALQLTPVNQNTLRPCFISEGLKCLSEAIIGETVQHFNRDCMFINPKFYQPKDIT